jgi:hypothetical protein
VLHNFYYSRNITRTKKSRRVKWVRHVAVVLGKRNKKIELQGVE